MIDFDSMQDVVIVATRRIVRPPKKGSAVVRPRTRTLTAVHDGILEDVVYPAEIVGKRVRYRLDGSKIIKVRSDHCIAMPDYCLGNSWSLCSLEYCIHTLPLCNFCTDSTILISFTLVNAKHLNIILSY